MTAEPPRRPGLDPEILNPGQRLLYDEIVAGPRGAPPLPLTAWIASPEMARRALALGEFMLGETVLAPRLVRLAAVVAARFWNALYLWTVHRRAAERLGIAASALEAIRSGRAPAFDDDAAAAAVYGFCVELLDRRVVSAPTYRRCVDAVGEQATVELVSAVGYFSMVGMTLNAFDLPLPEGMKPEL